MMAPLGNDRSATVHAGRRVAALFTVVRGIAMAPKTRIENGLLDKHEMSDPKVRGSCAKAMPVALNGREWNTPNSCIDIENGDTHDITNEEAATSATQPGAVRVEGIGSNRYATSVYHDNVENQGVLVHDNKIEDQDSFLLEATLVSNDASYK